MSFHMKSKITKREIAAFILGFITLFMVNLVVDWEDNEKAFKEGFEAGRAEATVNSDN